MPPRKLIEVNFFLIDLNSKDLEKLKKCFYNLISNKAFTKDSTKHMDMYKLAFVGSYKTENELGYNNIEIISDWQQYSITGIGDLFKGYEDAKPANLFKALSLAVFCLENDDLVDKFYIKRIILLSDLSSPLVTDKDINENAAQLKKKFQSENIWLYVLGPQVKIPYLQNRVDVKKWSNTVVPGVKLDAYQEKNYKAVKTVLNNGLVADFEAGLHLMLYYKSQIKPHFPWYADLKIGNEISLKVNVIKLVHEPPRVRLYYGSAQGEIITQPEKEWYDPNTNLSLYSEQVVYGYKIQRHKIVLSAEKEKAAIEKQRRNMPRCFEIFLFVDAEKASQFYYGEQSISRIVPDVRSSESSNKPLAVLTQAMRNLNKVAIAKRVHNNGPQFTPKPFIIFPCPDHKENCLLTARWPHRSDIEIENYRKGPQCKLELNNPELKSTVYGFLDSMTAYKNDFCDNGKIIHPLADNLMQNHSRMSKYEFLTKKCWNADENKNVLKSIMQEENIHPILLERSKPYLDVILELCPAEKEEKDDPQQCSTQ